MSESRATSDTAAHVVVSSSADTVPVQRLEPLSLHEHVRFLGSGGQRSLTIHPSLTSGVTLELGGSENRCVLISTKRFAEVREPGAAYVIYQPEVYRRTGGDDGYVTISGSPGDEPIKLGRWLAERGFDFSAFASREHCSVSIGEDGYILIEDHSTNGTFVRAREADVIDPPRVAAGS